MTINKKILFGISLLIIVVVTFLLWPKQQPTPTLPVIRADIGETTYKLYAPNTTGNQQIGLSAFDNISNNEGMIFRGNPVGVQGVWMKDMKFNIDIIWIDKDNRVVHLVENASKDSYPTIFQNPDSVVSAYIIELQSGQIKSRQINKGDEVQIKP